MIKFLKDCALIYCFLLTTSCGFNAIYDTRDLNKKNYLNNIEIDPSSNIQNAEFRYHLSKLLPQPFTPKYRLNVIFNNIATPQVILKNSEIFREDITILVQYTLREIDSGKILTQGKFKNMTSHDAMFEPYALNVVNETASLDLVKYSAEEIFKRLILYFNSKEA